MYNSAAAWCRFQLFIFFAFSLSLSFRSKSIASIVFSS